MKQSKFTYSIIAAIALVGLACQPSQNLDDYRWPPPPEEPRIVYIRTINSSDDLGRSFFGKIKDFFLGKSNDRGIGKPYGLTFDGKSKIYIADTATKGILVFDLGKGSSDFFNSLGQHGKLEEPVNVAVDRNGLIYVADTKLGRVVVFDRYYQFSHFIGADSAFEGPVGLAFDSDHEQLYIVDTQKHIVTIYSLDGRLLGQFGGRGDDQGQFYHPLNAVVSKGDTVYIVDSFHFAVQAFDREGNYLFSFGPRAAGVGTLARPRGIAIDSDGHIYVTDAIRNNIQIYSSTGHLLMAFGGGGILPGEFQLPAGIFIDSDDIIYIADSINRRIQMFQYLAEK